MAPPRRRHAALRRNGVGAPSAPAPATGRHNGAGGPRHASLGPGDPWRGIPDTDGPANDGLGMSGHLRSAAHVCMVPRGSGRCHHRGRQARAPPKPTRRRGEPSTTQHGVGVGPPTRQCRDNSNFTITDGPNEQTLKIL